MALTANRPLSEGLVLHLRMSEGVGTKTFDVSKYQNHGTINGASWVNGKYGKALSFNHVTGRVEITDTTGVFDGIPAITITFWSYTNSLTNYLVVFSKDDWTGYMCHTDSSGVLYFGVNGSTVRIAKENAFIIGLWQYFVCISTGNELLVYRNGVLLDSVAKVTTVPDTSGDLKIGCSADNGNIFDGIIDDVRIYNRALSLEELKLLYKSRGLV